MRNRFFLWFNCGCVAAFPVLVAAELTRTTMLIGCNLSNLEFNLPLGISAHGFWWMFLIPFIFCLAAGLLHRRAAESTKVVMVYSMLAWGAALIFIAYYFFAVSIHWLMM